MLYKCNFCNTTFTFNANRKVHQKKYHPTLYVRTPRKEKILHSVAQKSYYEKHRERINEAKRKKYEKTKEEKKKLGKRYTYLLHLDKMLDKVFTNVCTEVEINKIEKERFGTWVKNGVFVASPESIEDEIKLMEMELVEPSFLLKEFRHLKNWKAVGKAAKSINLENYNWKQFALEKSNYKRWESVVKDPEFINQIEKKKELLMECKEKKAEFQLWEKTKNELIYKPPVNKKPYAHRTIESFL